MLPTIDDNPATGLPVRPVIPRLMRELAAQGAAVLVAPPGSGKTTLVPLALAGEVVGRVIVAEPRRVAARAAAARMASLLGERVGATVGYTVRGDRKVGAATRIEVVTTGVLLRRLQNDPEQVGVGAIIIDECHERHLDTDLAVAFVHDVRQNLRDDLLLLAMSATAQADRLAAVLGDPAPIIEAVATPHYLDVRWRPPTVHVSPPHGLWVDPKLLRHVAAVVGEALRERTGDVLVFLPGVAEINKVATLLSSVDARIIALHGGQSGGRQDEALMAGSSRRVVLATSVAESSLTVPGVRVVVDAGLSREPRVDHVRGLGSLVTVSSSRASAEQRAGRSAREAPGTVYRCWAEVEHERLRAYADPEIAVADVTGAVLQLAAWGSVDGSGLALLDQLPAAALAKASELLRLLGAIDADGKVTARGRRLVSVGAHPRLARALLDGADHVGADVASETVALLSMDGRYPDDDVDVCLSRLRHGSDRGASAAWRKEVSRLARSLDGAAVKRVSHGAGLVLGLAYPERVARSRRHGAGGFLMTGGTAAEVRDGSALSGQEWIVVAEADRQPGRAVARVRLAASIDEATARLAASGMEEMVTSCSWVEGSIQSSVEHRLGAVVLSRKPGPELTMEQRARMWRNVFNDDGLGMLSWTNTAVSLRERLTFCHEWLGGEWPDVSDSVLIDRFDEWLLPDLVDVRRRAQVSKIDVASALRRLLPWRLVNALDEVAPERLRVPSGSRLRVDYADPRRPVLAGKLQEFFGMTANPQLAGGRATVVVHLLSPAGRPAAITSDLMSFWDDGYRQVRSELRGRYPKHPWPQDPRTASATAKTKRAAR